MHLFSWALQRTTSFSLWPYCVPRFFSRALLCTTSCRGSCTTLPRAHGSTTMGALINSADSMGEIIEYHNECK